MNPTQFHPEPYIMPLDSRGEELEPTLKLTNIDNLINLYIYICDKWPNVTSDSYCLRGPQKLVTKQICLDSD